MTQADYNVTNEFNQFEQEIDSEEIIPEENLLLIGDIVSDSYYIDDILTKLTTVGAMYLTLVCLMPEFLISKFPIPFYLGGTSILIVVVVAMDTVTQVQTRLMSHQYESLIKKTKIGR